MAAAGGKYEKCPRYWRGCFDCRWYLGPENALFCAAYNMRHYGSPVVEIEVKEEERTSWWSRRYGRRSDNKKSM